MVNNYYDYKNKGGPKFIYDLETSGLEPFEHRILCISMIDVETKEEKTFSGEDEQKFLQEFWEFVKGAEQLIGYNNHNFDFPFLITRTLFYGVKVDKHINQVDLRKESNGFWTSYKQKVKGKLSDWAEKFGMKVCTNNGNEMPAMYAQGNWNGICEHCIEDVRITFELYKRCKECGLFDE
jgi:predicted PolB exonuclease-like 3'-5' exonuclease